MNQHLSKSTLSRLRRRCPLPSRKASATVHCQLKPFGALKCFVPPAGVRLCDNTNVLELRRKKIHNPQIFIRCPSFQWKRAPPAKFNDKWAFNNSAVFIYLFFTPWTAVFCILSGIAAAQSQGNTQSRAVRCTPCVFTFRPLMTLHWVHLQIVRLILLSIWLKNPYRITLTYSLTFM